MQLKDENKTLGGFCFALMVVPIVGQFSTHCVVKQSHDLLTLANRTEEIEVVGISCALEFAFHDCFAAVICLATIKFSIHELSFACIADHFGAAPRRSVTETIIRFHSLSSIARSTVSMTTRFSSERRAEISTTPISAGEVVQWIATPLLLQDDTPKTANHLRSYL